MKIGQTNDLGKKRRQEKEKNRKSDEGSLKRKAESKNNIVYEGERYRDTVKIFEKIAAKY